MTIARFTLICCIVMICGCSKGVTDAQIEAAIKQCIAKNQGNVGGKVESQNTDPQVAAELEASANQAVAEANEALKKQVEDMCRQTMPAACKANPDQCSSL